MPYDRITGYRFDRFSSKAEAHLICKLLKDFKIAVNPEVRKLGYVDKLIRCYGGKTIPVNHKWKESDCDYGVFYDGLTCKLPELKKKLSPLLDLWTVKELNAMAYFRLHFTPVTNDNV